MQQKTFVSFQFGEPPEGFVFPDADAWIMARELLVFKSVDFSDVPKNQRLKALGQKVKQLSPFRRSGHYVHWAGGHAMVWVWDEDLRSQSVAEMCERFTPLASHFRNLPVLPETLLYPKQTVGHYQQPCVDGSDIQVWREGRLVSSNWTPENILVGVTPASTSSAWNDELTTALDEKVLWQSGLHVLGLVAIFQLGNSLGLFLRDELITNRLSEAEAEMSSVLAVRSRVGKFKAASDAIESWFAQPSQLSLMAEFDRLMPQTVEIISWAYENRILEVQLKDEALDNRLYIEQLGQSPRFLAPKVEPGSSPDNVTVVFGVLPR